jgi:hypothetical protein
MKTLSVVFVFAGLAVLMLAAARAGEGLIEDGAKLGPEMLINGDFEKGDGTPEGWDEVDDLSSYYVKRPGGKGMCLKFDSDIYPKDVDARAEEMKLPRDKRPRAKPKTPTSGKKYNTIAGGRGALLWSDYIEVESGSTYRLVAEVNTYAPEVKLFIKGYAEVKGERRIGYKKYLTCLPEDKNNLGNWVWYSTDFTPENPHNKKLKFNWIKVMIMVFWPPGEAYIDNISIKKILEPGKKESEEKEPKRKEK